MIADEHAFTPLPESGLQSPLSGSSLAYSKAYLTCRLVVPLLDPDGLDVKSLGRAKAEAAASPASSSTVPASWKSTAAATPTAPVATAALVRVGWFCSANHHHVMDSCATRVLHPSGSRCGSASGSVGESSP